jgi:hypothetical protein
MKYRNPLAGAVALLVGAMLLTAGSGTRISAAEALEATDIVAIDRGLDRASRFVLGAQAADGAWRASRYPALADGASLTPLVMRSLRERRQLAAVAEAWQRGMDYLARVRPSDGESELPPESLKYPLYTAAGALLALPDTPANRGLRGAWIEFIAKRQLTEPLGWQAADGEYGGWSYARALPHKPTTSAMPRSPLDVANLSATAFAIEALRFGGRPPDHPCFARALRFVTHCQNYAENGHREPRFDDGGFFFVLEDATRNKAGIAGSDGAGRIRYCSYASATADGLRALRLCGLSQDHPRVVAARDWLKHSLVELETAKDLSPDTSQWRASSFYYACWSLGLSLDAFTAGEAATLAGALLSRQQSDGSWNNPAVDLREDDCLVATPLAIEALSCCRRRMAAR